MGLPQSSPPQTSVYCPWEAVCVLSLFILLGTHFLLESQNSIAERELVEPKHFVQLDNFNKGQYYFNHDDDPAPPYDLKLARRYFNQVILDDPKENPLVWYQLGRIDFLEGKFDKAIFNFNKQLEFFGDTVPNVYYMLGLAYGYKARETQKASDWSAAAMFFKKSIEHFPEQPWPKVDLAWAYFSAGQYEDMRFALEPYYEQHRSNPWFSNMFGLALLHTGERERAHGVFIEAEAQALALSTEQWGHSYPGNHPDTWPKGLEQMRKAIAENVALTAATSSEAWEL